MERGKIHIANNLLYEIEGLEEFLDDNCSNMILKMHLKDSGKSYYLSPKSLGEDRFKDLMASAKRVIESRLQELRKQLSEL